MKKRAVVTGVTGQDGYYMAELLVEKGYEVFGVIRPSLKCLTMIGSSSNLFTDMALCPVDLLDVSKVSDFFIHVKPHEVYNFAAVSDVFEPWDNISLTFDTNIKIPQNILECIISMNGDIKFLQASSSLVFGRNDDGNQNELTQRNPIYPYGISKNTVDDLISEARITYDVKACSAIFFNHESPRRKDFFFSKKIAKAVAEIKAGARELISVGNISTYRDYGYAKDYMEAAFLMLQADIPKDYVVGTGQVILMSDYIKKCFEYIGLNYENHIYVDHSLYRENETKILKADISKIKNELGWSPKTGIDALVAIMMEDSLKGNITNY